MTANGDVLVRAQGTRVVLVRHERRRARAATGADTIEELIERLKSIIPELLELNGIDSPTTSRSSCWRGADCRRRRGLMADYTPL